MGSLVTWMHSRGIKTVRALAAELGLEESFVSRLVRGVRKPGLECALKIEARTGGAVKASDWFARPQRRRAINASR